MIKLFEFGIEILVCVKKALTHKVKIIKIKNMIKVFLILKIKVLIFI